jgi:hypothetical protein
MEGHGVYNRSSRVQAAGLSPAVPLFVQAAESVPLAAAPQPVIVADYGSSEGHNSLEPIAAAITALRKRVWPERAISVVHTDLPDNDFTALFRTLATDPQSYLGGDTAVFPSAIGRSFYEQILPANSVTLGWCSWAVQWLSKVPAPIPDQVQVSFSKDPVARSSYARQADEDWRTFLTQRGRELRPGGQLVVLTMAVDEAGNFGYRPLLEAMYAALLEMVEEGFIQAEEARRMAIPTVGRSRADFLAPFVDGGSFADLSIKQVEVFPGEDKIWAQFEGDRDAQAFGARWAAFSRASVFPTLASGLTGRHDDARAATFVDRLEAGMTMRLAKAPERMLIPLGKLVVEKNEG